MQSFLKTSKPFPVKEKVDNAETSGTSKPAKKKRLQPWVEK